MEVLAAHIGFFQADQHQIVALGGFLGDDLGAGSFVHDGGDLDRRIDLLLDLLLALDLFGRLLDGLAGVFRLLCLFFRLGFIRHLLLGGRLVVFHRFGLFRIGLLVGGLALRLALDGDRIGRGRFLTFRQRLDLRGIGDMQHRGRHAVRACQHAGDARGELAVRAVVDGDQQTLKVGDKAFCFLLLAVEPLLFFLAHRNARQRPAQGRGHRQSRYHSHGDDHGEKILVERAHRQADGGDDHFGRAARIHAAGQREALAPRQPADLGADKGAAELAQAGDHDETRGHRRHARIAEDGQVGAQAGNAEKDRCEERGDNAAQLLVDMASEDRRLPDQDAGDEGAEHRMHADEIGQQGHRPHDDQDAGDDSEVADEIVIGPADGEEHRAASDGQAHHHEQEGADNALRQRQRIDFAVQGEAEDDRDDDPADAVVDDGGGEDDLADSAAHEIHLAHHHGDDLDRGDRQRGAEEQRGDQPLAGIGQHGVGDKFAERDATGERNENAHQRGEDRGLAGLAHQLEIGLHAGEQQQQQNAELRDGVDYRLLFGIFRKQRVLEVRQQQTEDRGAEQEPCDQLTHHRRLAHANHGFAKQAPGQHQDQDLGNENDLGRAFVRFAGGQSRAGGQP